MYNNWDCGTFVRHKNQATQKTLSSAEQSNAMDEDLWGHMHGGPVVFIPESLSKPRRVMAVHISSWSLFFTPNVQQQQHRDCASSAEVFINTWCLYSDDDDEQW